MPHRTPRNPLHGVTLEAMLTFLVAQCGWEEMGREIDIRCFKFDPSIPSSLQFLRRTPWARAKVEALYLRIQKQAAATADPAAPAQPPSASATAPRAASASRFLGAGGQDRSAVRAHAMNRAHAHFKSDNRAKV